MGQGYPGRQYQARVARPPLLGRWRIAVIKSQSRWRRSCRATPCARAGALAAIRAPPRRRRASLSASAGANAARLFSLRLAHDHRGALPADLLVAREGRRPARRNTCRGRPRRRNRPRSTSRRPGPGTASVGWQASPSNVTRPLVQAAIGAADHQAPICRASRSDDDGSARRRASRGSRWRARPWCPRVTQDSICQSSRSDEADEVHDLAAAHRIVQHMTVRSEPVDALHPRADAPATSPSAPSRARRRQPVNMRLARRRTGRRGPWNGCRRRRSRKPRVTVLAVLERRLRRGRRPRRRATQRRFERDRVGLERAHRVGEKAVQIAPVQHDMRACRYRSMLLSPRSNQFQVSPVLQCRSSRRSTAAPGLWRGPLPGRAQTGRACRWS